MISFRYLQIYSFMDKNYIFANNSLKISLI